MPHDVISTCPVCSSELAVTRLHCRSCGTTLEGDFSVGRFGRLTREQMTLLESFLRSRGNLRDMERELGISYPTVRSRVEALVRALGFGPRGDDEAVDDAAAAPATAPPPTRRPARRSSSGSPAMRSAPRRPPWPSARSGGIDERDRHGPADRAPHRRDRRPDVRLADWDVEVIAGRWRRRPGPERGRRPAARRPRDRASAPTARDPPAEPVRHRPRSAAPRVRRRSRSRSRSRRPSRSRPRAATSRRPACGARSSARTASGDLLLVDVAGEVQVETVSGDVAIRLDGPTGLAVKTVSGDCDRRGRPGRPVRVQTTSGDVRLTSELGDGPHAIETVSGDVIVTTTERHPDRGPDRHRRPQQRAAAHVRGPARPPLAHRRRGRDRASSSGRSPATSGSSGRTAPSTDGDPSAARAARSADTPSPPIVPRPRRSSPPHRRRTPAPNPNRAPPRHRRRTEPDEPRTRPPRPPASTSSVPSSAARSTSTRPTNRLAGARRADR